MTTVHECCKSAKHTQKWRRFWKTKAFASRHRLSKCVFTGPTVRKHTIQQRRLPKTYERGDFFLLNWCLFEWIDELNRAKQGRSGKGGEKNATAFVESQSRRYWSVKSRMSEWPPTRMAPVIQSCSLAVHWTESRKQEDGPHRSYENFNTTPKVASKGKRLGKDIFGW